jgi:hypothetical protein
MDPVALAASLASSAKLVQHSPTARPASDLERTSQGRDEALMAWLSHLPNEKRAERDKDMLMNRSSSDRSPDAMRWLDDAFGRLSGDSLNSVID